MPTRRHLSLALAIGLSCVAPAFAGTPVANYSTARATEARALPIHIGIVSQRIRPQMAFQYTSYDGRSMPPPNSQGLSAMQGAAANALGGVLAEAITNKSMRELAEDEARIRFGHVTRNRCDFAYGDRLATSLTESFRDAWTDAKVEVHFLEPEQSIEDVVGKQAPRYEILASITLLPDGSTLAGSIDARAFTADSGSGQSSKTPDWEDNMVAIGDLPPSLPTKTPLDTEQMLADEAARFEALDLGQTIRRLNAEGATSANKLDRQRVGKLTALHQRAIKEAKRPKWTPLAQSLRRSAMLSASDCAGMQTALEQVLAGTRTLMDDLLDGRLPTSSGTEVSPGPEEQSPGERRTSKAHARSIARLPDGTILLHRPGDLPLLAHRHSILLDP